MDDLIIKKTLEFWQTQIVSAEYDSGGKTFEVPLTSSRIDQENNKLIIDFTINDDIEEDTVVTEVRWVDKDGGIWDRSTESIIRESYVEGILYRYSLSLRKDY